MEKLPDVLSGGQAKPHSDTEKGELFKQIGQLKVELDFLQKGNWLARLSRSGNGSTRLIRNSA